jgi:hypothetical protein
VGDVVILNGWTNLDIPVERVLEGARDLEYVLILGVKQDGSFVAASNKADLRQGLWAASKYIHKVHNGDYTDGDT